MRGDEIRSIRQSLGFTQAQLAQRLKVTQAVISQWETGRAAPSIEHVLRLIGITRSTNARNPVTNSHSPVGRSAAALAAPRASGLTLGWKVSVIGREAQGFGELYTYPDEDDHVEVAYYQSPVGFERIRVPRVALRRDLLPLQTRCYFVSDTAIRIGRVVLAHDASASETRRYDIRLPNGELRRGVSETDFRIRSYGKAADPVLTLAALAQETPFFFERRAAWADEYAKQVAGCHGLTGLLSSRIELFPHQVEVVRRVLQDPTIRYLLADEVGLGKTIEAGVILRQLRLDDPTITIGVCVPGVLVEQWRRELEDRFGLNSVDVFEHERLLDGSVGDYDMVVVDEAHRIVHDVNAEDSGAASPLFTAARKIAAPDRTRHLLLLSATPAIHRDEQLFALLHLLDPEAYRFEELEGFRVRLAARRDLGRALLALSRTTHTAFMERHLQKISSFVPDDAVVAGLVNKAVGAKGAADGENTMRKAAVDLRVHVTETYRIHRRFLRTRRSALVENGDLVQHRRAGTAEVEASESDECAEALTRLWQALEDWRVHAASFQTRAEPTAVESWIRTYLVLASNCANDREALSEFVDDRIARAEYEFETPLLQALAEAARHALLVAPRAAVVNRLAARLERGKWVWFCGTIRGATEVTQAAARRDVHGKRSLVTGASVGVESFLVTFEKSDLENARSLRDFCRSSSDGLTWLVTDHSGEEGINLQAAGGLVLYDLPFDPMRLEQRIGRLDRINRKNDLFVIPVLSIDDPELALDAAWYHVLTQGLGILEGSLADLQFLLEREMKAVGEAAFLGGPTALTAEAGRLRAVITQERDLAAEHDILDGLYVGASTSSKLWRDLESVECNEQSFGTALKQYVEDNLGLSVVDESIDTGGRVSPAASTRRGSVPRVFTIRQRGDAQPLLPATLLTPLAGVANLPATVFRTAATRSADLAFVRPGQESVDALWRIAAWDERGRAYAMWRRANGVMEPDLVFRFALDVTIDEAPVLEALQAKTWDLASRASLLRLVRRWAPTHRYEIALQQDGTPCDAVRARLCGATYESAFDINLGGERASTLVDLVGAADWRATCQRTAAMALKSIGTSAQVRARTAHAISRAEEHFSMLRARLRNREAHGWDSNFALGTQRDEILRVAALVHDILNAPVVRVDSLGVYVLSEYPVCAR